MKKILITAMLKKQLCKKACFAAAHLVLIMTVEPGYAQKVKTLKDHVAAFVTRLKPVSHMPAGSNLDFIIGLPLRNQETLDNLLQQLYDPSSPDFHQYLTPGQFAEKFGPSEEDYNKVMAFAKSGGLTITSTQPDRTFIKVAGTVANIEKTFRTNLLLFKYPNESRTFYSPGTDPSVSADLPILHITGLDNITAKDSLVRFNPANKTTSTGPAMGSAPGGTGAFTSRDFRQVYANGTVLNGAGQAVGIYNPPHGFNNSDITMYESLSGITPQVPVNKVLIDGVDAAVDGYSGEVTLDIEMAIAMAPGLSEVIVYQGKDYLSTFKRMATDNKAKQLTSSWPTPLQDANATQIYKQFAAQGQTFFCASGDAGSYYPTQPFSATHPYITVVSGTILTTKTDGTRASEVVWHDSFGSGGGGNMGLFPIPDWQKGINMSANFGSVTFRNSPDVSMPADNVFYVFGGNTGSSGGTSAASPLWAGYTALINQKALQSGKQTVGFLNPSLYALGRSSSYHTYFNDITSGNNLTPWNKQPGNDHQYLAVPGYDLCTGWGTPNGTKLIDALSLYGPLQSNVNVSQIKIAKNKDGSQEMFAIGKDKAVYHISQSQPNGNWGAWSSLGGHDINQISVGKNADGRLEVFALGTDKIAYHIWQSSPGGSWSQWVSLAGHDLQQILVGNNADGRLELFALGADKAVYHIWQTAVNGGWNTWSSLGGHDLQQMAVGNNADGRMELFALGGDKAIYHIWQASPNGGWNTWSSLAGHDLQQMVVANNADGRMELFALGGDNAVYHVWQASPNGGWGAWSSLAGHDLRQITASGNADGRLDLFALGGDNAVYHIWQASPNGGWGAWSSLTGHDLQQMTVGINADGRLELFALGADALVYHRWQTTANGNWGNWTLLQ